MAKEELDWLQSNKCKYCGCELAFKSGSERIICRRCGKINYKNRKVEFSNIMRKRLMKGRKKC